jgi:23S rRNA pseudouridine2457 synthase
LDTDSEGLLLLTNHGGLQHYVSHPKTKLPKTYWVQVEGEPSEAQLNALKNGVDLGDFVTLPAQVKRINPPDIWPRIPPIRVRLSIPDRWLELTIVEGKNRQVRRMTAKVGLPTLRLIRVAIGPWRVDNLAQGNSQLLHISDDFSTLAACR